MSKMDFLPHIYLAGFDGCEKELSMAALDAVLQGRKKEGLLSEFAELLQKKDPERLMRIGQMKVPEDRLRSFWAGVLLQGAVLHQTGAYASVAYRKSGKPYIRNPEHLRISLTHSGDLVAVALSVTDTGDTVDLSRGRNCRRGICSLGIDIEQNRTILHPDKFLRYCMEDSEREAFSACSGGAEKVDLLHLWTVKESVLKCFGTGLGVSPKMAHIIPEALFDNRILPAGSNDSSDSFRLLPFEDHPEGSGDRKVYPEVLHWQVSEEDLKYFAHGALADLEHHVIEKRREVSAAKGPDPLCEADGAPVRYACCTGKLGFGKGDAYLSLCMKFYEEDPAISGL